MVSPREDGEGQREKESDDERAARHEAEAAGLFRSVIAEATGDQVGAQAQGPACDVALPDRVLQGF